MYARGWAFCRRRWAFRRWAIRRWANRRWAIRRWAKRRAPRVTDGSQYARGECGFGARFLASSEPVLSVLVLVSRALRHDSQYGRLSLQVDCTENRPVCSDLEVRGYPTLLWIVNGKKVGNISARYDKSWSGNPYISLQTLFFLFFF